MWVKYNQSQSATKMKYDKTISRRNSNRKRQNQLTVGRWYYLGEAAVLKNKVLK